MSEVNGDHKRKREASKEKEEEDALDADNEQEEEMLLDSPNTPDSTSSLLPRSIIDDLLNDNFIHILSRKVETDLELKQLAEELFQSLRNAVEDVEQVSIFVAGVKKLFESAVFIQACVETYMEDPYLLIKLEPNSNADGKEQMEALKNDILFQSIFQETQTTAIFRGVLAVVFGYWSDKDCYRKVSEAITGELQKNFKPYRGPPLEMAHDSIPNIDVSSDIEGLKEALATRYRNDPNHDFNHICEEIEKNKSYFEHMIGPLSIGLIPKRIRRLGVLWMGNSLTLSRLDFSC